MSRRAEERRFERDTSGLCTWCGKLPQFWGKRCILCRQLFTKNPLPSGAKRALRNYRKAEAERERENREKNERHAIFELIGSGRISGDAAEALRLYAGIEFGERRSYREVGKLMNISREAVRQRLLSAKIALDGNATSRRPARLTPTAQAPLEPGCEFCHDNGSNLLKDGSYIYKDCGLNHVFLLGLKPRSCGACKRQVVAIPSNCTLNRLIAKVLIQKNGPLNGRELRFLRVATNSSALEFALRLGIGLTTLLSWEESPSLRYRNDLVAKIVVGALLDREESLRIGDVVAALKYRSAIDREIRIRWIDNEQRWERFETK